MSANEAPNEAWGRLSRHPVHRRQVLRLIADGSQTQQEIADTYGVTQSAVSQFAKKHADVIEDMRADMDNQFAGILFASKEARLQQYSDDVLAEMATLQDRHRALKSIAEELGELPNRLSVDADVRAQVEYRVVNVNTEHLT